MDEVSARTTRTLVVTTPSTRSLQTELIVTVADEMDADRITDIHRLRECRLELLGEPDPRKVSGSSVQAAGDDVHAVDDRSARLRAPGSQRAHVQWIPIVRKRREIGVTVGRKKRSWRSCLRSC